MLNTVLRKGTALKALEADVRGRVLSLGMAASKAALPKVQEAGEAVLLDRVRAAPDDPSSREVLRDLLLERGDPWGELIALQEHRAKSGEAKVSARERSLLKELRPRILGSLAGVKKSVLDDLEFERGFPVAATVKVKGVTRVAALLSRPELSTLERVWFMRDATLTPNLKVLREAHGLKADSLATALKKAPDVKLEALTVEGTPAQLQEIEGLESLRELFVMIRLAPHRVLRAVAHLPLMKQLRVFGMVQVWAPEAFIDWSWEAIDALPSSVQAVVVETIGGLVGRFVLARAKDGWDAKVEPPVSRWAQHPGMGSVPYDAQAVQRAKVVLEESRSVQFSDGVDEQTRAALAP